MALFVGALSLRFNPSEASPLRFNPSEALSLWFDPLEALSLRFDHFQASPFQFDHLKVPPYVVRRRCHLRFDHLEALPLRFDHAEALPLWFDHLEVSSFAVRSCGDGVWSIHMSQWLKQSMLPAAMPVPLPDSAGRVGDSVPLINGGEPIQALHPAQNTGKG
jgi:hypothetical protein